MPQAILDLYNQQDARDALAGWQAAREGFKLECGKPQSWRDGWCLWHHRESPYAKVSADWQVGRFH